MPTAEAVPNSRRASTQTPYTKEHLHQTGEYQMQDVLLTEQFRVYSTMYLAADAS